MPDHVVTLYSRPGCHLCDDAAALLQALAQEFGFRIAIVDIEKDPTLVARYGEAVPVVTHAGSEVARASINEQALRAALRERLAIG